MIMILIMCPRIIGKLTEICTKNQIHRIVEAMIWKNAKPPISAIPFVPVRFGSPPPNNSIEIEPSKKASNPVRNVKKCACPHSCFRSRNWNFHSLRNWSTVPRSGCRLPNSLSNWMSIKRNGIESCSSDGRLISTTTSSAMLWGGGIPF